MKQQKLFKGETEEEMIKNNMYIRMKRLHKQRPMFFVVYNNGLKAVIKLRSSTHTHSAVSAYKISKLLNLKIVPPTIMKNINGKPRIIQMFVESVKDKKKYLNYLSPIQKSNLYAYIFVAGIVDMWHENILISKNCFKPVLIDTDGMKINLNQYGVPFHPFTIEIETPHPFLSYEDYRRAPIEKAVKMRYSSFIPFLDQTILPETLKSGLGDPKTLLKIKTEYINHSHRWPPDSTISYLKYKDTYWITETERFNHLFVSKYLFPIEKTSDFSRKTLRKLKKLNHSLLKQVLAGDYGKSQTFINGILFRRDLLLGEVEKMKKKEQHQ